MNIAGPLLGDSHLGGSPWTIANGVSTDGDPVKVEVRPGAAHVLILHGSRGNAIALPEPVGFAARIHRSLTGHRVDWHPGPMILGNR
jgi:hypothetical protein